MLMLLGISTISGNFITFQKNGWKYPKNSDCLFQRLDPDMSTQEFGNILYNNTIDPCLNNGFMVVRKNKMRCYCFSTGYYGVCCERKCDFKDKKLPNECRLFNMF